MRTSRLGTVVAIPGVLLLAALMGSTAVEAAQCGKAAAGKADAKCCADVSKAQCCQEAKCCRAGSKKACCRESGTAQGCCKAAVSKCGQKVKCCEKKSQAACCPKAGACDAKQRRACGGARPCGSKSASQAACQTKQSTGAGKGPSKAGDAPAAQWTKAVARLKKIGYTDEDIAFLPTSAVLASAGAKNVVSYAKPKPGETVLDLGCGGGIDCLLAARLVGSSGKVIGVDMSPKALATARKNLEELGLTNVEFRQGRLEKLPLDDASVDVAISNCVGIVMRGDAAVLSEAARVLKPGGRLVTTGRLRDEYRAKLKAAGFTTIEQPAKGMIVARKPK